MEKIMFVNKVKGIDQLQFIIALPAFNQLLAKIQVKVAQFTLPTSNNTLSLLYISLEKNAYWFFKKAI